MNKYVNNGFLQLGALLGLVKRQESWEMLLSERNAWAQSAVNHLLFNSILYVKSFTYFGLRLGIKENSREFVGYAII